MYSTVHFVMAKFGLDYGKAVSRIERDIPLMQVSDPLPTEKEELFFDFVPAPFADGYHYWARYKIPITSAARFSFYAKSVYRNETFYGRSTKQNPIFIYKFPSGRMKLYRPLGEKDKKWGGNATAEDVGGFFQLPRKGVLCFVTSSIKDVMVLHQHGFPAVCFNGEGYGKGEGESTKVVEMYGGIIRRRFRYQLLFLDNDDAGLSASLILSKKLKMPYVTTGSSCKDISDYQAKYGIKSTYRLIKKLITSKFKLTDNAPY